MAVFAQLSVCLLVCFALHEGSSRIPLQLNARIKGRQAGSEIREEKKHGLGPRYLAVTSEAVLLAQGKTLEPA